MLVYREKDNLIHKLHPFTLIFYIGIVFLLSLVFNHPIYLLGLFLAVGAVIIAGGHFSEWKVYLKFSVTMIIIIMVINAIFVQAGDTVLLVGPRVPVLGKIVITLEALAFGAGMGIRLLVMISIFCLYTYAVHPDKALKLFSRLGNKSVLVITLSTRLFPLMVRDFQRITEVQRCRGVKLDTGRWWERAKNLLPVISVLLLSCLERSLQLAESMHARGYGSGSRSYYSRELWRPRDYLILSALIIGLISGLWAALKGWSTYSYYPRLTLFNPGELKTAVIVVITLAVPAILNWGWKKWPLLRSKI
ncbi:MAG: energy-coupling factor transport system permease protein [Clostridia bacterium]|jgi:energy-coupling factor transport system permease protein|nr:energy-coupling factor transporter transrane protein EcfT [Clostridiales bacterium]MDK2985430.1 energy-coupling factor transport system permease protein [Clostridia bacterium]